MTNNKQQEVSIHAPAFTAATIALLLWSGTAIANKVAVVYIDALSAGVLRSVFAGMIAAIIAIAFRLPFPKSLRDMVTLCVSGICSFAIWPSLLSLGISYTTAGHAAIIMAIIPILTILIASMINGRSPHIGWWTGATVAVAGAASLVLSHTGSVTLAMDDSSAFGDTIVFFGCIACSMGYVAGGKLSRKLGTVATTFWGLATALVILLPLFVAISDRTAWSNIPAEAWYALAWMTLLSSIIGYALWFFALGQGGIRRIGSLQLAMPVITLAASTLLLDEALTTLLLLTCTVIVTGTFVAHRYAD